LHENVARSIVGPNIGLEQHFPNCDPKVGCEAQTSGPPEFLEIFIYLSFTRKF